MNLLKVFSNKNNIYMWLVCMISVILTGCQLKEVNSQLEETLNVSKDNEQELLKVVDYFTKKGDTLQLKAANFLLENMADKYWLGGSSVAEYYTFIDSVYQIKQEEYDIPYIYSCFIKRAKHLKDKPQYLMDAEKIKASYLIKNIEEAFNVWNKPWNQFLTFEEFCEYILPYKVNKEEPQEWRNLYANRFSQAIPASIQTAETACCEVNNQLIGLPIHISTSSIMPIDLRPSTLYNIKFGLCSDYTALGVYAMRSVGIPVGENLIPHWGNSNLGHVFNFVYGNDRKYHDFASGEQNPDEHLVRFKNKIPKIYKMTFGRQNTSLGVISKDLEDVPSFFKNPCLEDVTGKYAVVNAQTTEIDISNKQNNKFAYLCVFDPQGWFPVAWTQIEGDKAVFKNIGPNIVYQAALYDKGEIQPVDNPFFLDSIGRKAYFVPQKRKQQLRLERKKENSSSLEEIALYMKGGKFQGANKKDFSDAVTYHVIKATPKPKYTTVICDESAQNRPVKYLCYLSSDETYGNMAEVEFYACGQLKPQKGKIIGKYETSRFYPRNGAEKMFDGDPLSFFHTNDTLSWGGLELKQPVCINKIRYLIRNDDNGIRKGHLYELFYCKDGVWTSLGKKRAILDDELIYKNVPQGALLWLRDLTKGQEERIFEYKNKKVYWY